MAKIGIFDSGVGGLSVFKEIHRLLPDSSYVYYGDNANCPYGIKGPEFIVKRSKELSEFLISEGVDIIVVACNTATSYSVETLQKCYDVPIIGTVPGVKPAAAETKTGVIGVLATFGTLNAPLYNRIKDRWGANIEVIEHIGQGFVELVERLELSGRHAESVVEESVWPLVSKGADTLVLGCTHYPFLRKTIEEVANRIKPASVSRVEVYDTAPAIARNVAEILTKSHVQLKDDNPTVKLIASGNDSVMKALYKKCIE